MRRNFCIGIWIVLALLVGNSTGFIFKWPFSFFFPGTTTTTGTATTTFGAGTFNYGFLRPAILVPIPTTTTAATTTTRPSQIFINGFPVTNNSILISLANALANRPLGIGGIAQPLPGIIGGGIATGGITGQIPGVVGGVASPIGGTGGLVLPPGFPAGGGVAASGILPGLFPGLFGRSNRGQQDTSKGSPKPSNSRVVFEAKK